MDLQMRKIPTPTPRWFQHTLYVEITNIRCFLFFALRYHKGSNYFEKTNKIEDKCGDCSTAELADIEALRAIYII